MYQRSISSFIMAGLTAAIVAAVPQPVQSEALDKPNVIFILTDDMGYADMGCAGNPYIKTPNIDRLAHEGTMFTRFHVNSGVCAPSRTAFMTGMFPARNNAHHIYLHKEYNQEHGVPDYLDPGLLTLADVMKQAGYTTGHIGKWHLAGKVPGSPRASEYGFDVDMITHGAGQSPVYHQRWKTTEHQVTASSHWIMEDAVDFIKQYKDKPFFLNLWTLVPHSLLKPTPEELAVYDGLTVNPDDFTSWMKEYVEDARDPDSQMKVYAASMTSLDAAIGKLLDVLDETGLAENTIILFSSDNGPEDYHVGNTRNGGLGSPGEYRGRKRSPYLGGMRVPMLVRWPARLPAGVRNDAVWSAVEFLPTFASLLGVELPADLDIDGENVAPLLTGSTQGRKAPLFWEWKFERFGNPAYNAPQLCMLDDIWWAGCNPDGSRVELYDVNSDPAQRNNLKDQKPETAARMVKELNAWKKTIPESAYPTTTTATSSTEDSVQLSAVKRAGYEPFTGVARNKEAGGGTGVFGCAETKREVYIWFEVPEGLPAGLSSKNNWELELVVSKRSGKPQTPQAADELLVDYMGIFDEIRSDSSSLAAYAAAEPVQAFIPDFREALLVGRHCLALKGFEGDNLKPGGYLLFRLSDASPERMHWSSCSLKSMLKVR